MYVREYLSGSNEPMPLWLKNYKKGDKLDFDEILSHRVVYYPGSYLDGQAVRTFNKAHYAHTFFYVDYILEKERLTEELFKDEAFKGYELYDLREVTQSELLPRPWTPPQLDPEIIEASKEFVDQNQKPYCLLAIFEREDKYTDDHGAERFAIIFLFADAIATYHAMFISQNRVPAVLLYEDHGFGCLYSKFGHGGLLERLAKDANSYPQFIMTREGSEWTGYAKVTGVYFETRDHDLGTRRFLYKKL